MFKVSLDREVPVEKFIEYLNESRKIYVNPGKLKEAVKDLEKLVDVRRRELLGLMYAVTSRRYQYVDKYEMIDYLLACGLPEKLFCGPRGNNPTYLNEDIYKLMQAKYYVPDGYELYRDYKKKLAELNKMNKMLDRSYQITGVKSNYGEELQEISYLVEPTLNLRFSTKQENVIGFAGTVGKAITAPEGYYIMSCDFPQIDARVALNMYLKNSEVVSLSEQIEDTYLVFKEYARRVRHEIDKRELEHINNMGYFNDRQDLENRIDNYYNGILPFESPEERSLYKVTALSTIYHRRYSPYQDEQRTINQLVAMYNANERYARMGYLCELLYNNNIPLRVTSRWGAAKRPIRERDYKATIQSIFNAPIQSTSSEVIIMYITHFLDYFRDKGYGVKDVHLCMNRHDEPVFLIKKEVFHDHINFIAGMRTYLVEGWQPMELEFYVGDTYKSNDEYAKSLIERVPSEYRMAKIEAEKYKDLQEPFPLAEPKIVFGAWATIQGTAYLALMWYEGKLSDKIDLSKEYRDRRDIKVQVLKEDLDTPNITKESILNMLTAYIGGDKEDEEEYLFVLPGSAHGDHELAGKLAYVRSNGGDYERNICRGILASVAKSQGIEVPYTEDNFLRALDEVAHRIKQ